MAFNPNIVPGFPAVVLDRPLTALEKSENRHRKHFVGQVVTVTHSISPTQAVTQIQMVAVRPYDEDIDFETKASGAAAGESSSLEQVAMGFDADEAYFDERYSPSKIGTEFYKKILGCDSIVDDYSRSSSLEDTSSVAILLKIPGNNETDTVAKAVLALSNLYDVALEAKADLAAFTSALTWRPKVTMTQILGSKVASSASNPTSKNYPDVSPKTDAEAEGFMASAVDADSADAAATYTSTSLSTSTESVPGAGEVVKTVSPVTNNEVETTTTTSVQVTSTTAGSGGETTYGLDSELKERQELLKAYLEAIKYRGIRG
jgi:hypothetical protein